MWISRKTAEIGDLSSFGSRIGVVSVGGRKPAIVTDGETRSAEIAVNGGALYVPKVGDQVLLERTSDDERVVLGRIAEAIPEGLAEGDIYISAVGGSAIHIKSNGEIRISGTTRIDGVLLINGQPYVSGG